MILERNRRVSKWAATAVVLVSILGVSSCGHQLGLRHFAGPIQPAAEQPADFLVGDDRSITFIKDRLEVTLIPLTPDMLNRQLASHSQSPPGFSNPNPYVAPTNPYTYGDWKPQGQTEAPPRFSVFFLRVKNYAYPKVRIDPANIQLISSNGRHYPALSLAALVEYYWPYAVAYAGNTYGPFKERTSLLKRTLFSDDMIFSGQEKEGFVAFTGLYRDVEDFTIHIRDMILRFDFRDEPVETIDLAYRFSRDVYVAREPRAD